MKPFNFPPIPFFPFTCHLALISKGERGEFLSTHPLKALLPLKKGGREGFLGRPFQNAKALPMFNVRCSKFNVEPPGELGGISS